MDRLDELAIFLAILEAGSLAAAGRRLRRSPPVVTRALANLEERLGTRLLERTTRRLAPTDEGRALAEQAKRLIADYEAATREAGASAIRGELRVTAPIVFGRRHVTPLVIEFLDLHPQVRIELVLNDRNLDLIDEDLQVAVRIGQLAHSGLVSRRVGEVRRLLVAAPDYLARRGTPRTPAELSGHHTIFGASVVTVPSWQFGPGSRGPSVRLEPRLVVNEVEAMLRAIRAGRGIGRALSYQVADEIADGSLVALLRQFEPPPLPVQLVVPGRRYMAGRVRAFLDFAAERLGRLPVIRPNGT